MTSPGGKQREIDRVEEAGYDSFPASDPPGWMSMRPGGPDRVEQRVRADPEACQIWNAALEKAARLVENASSGSSALPADIRNLKQTAPS